jgi:hypothetical protein
MNGTLAAGWLVAPVRTPVDTLHGVVQQLPAFCAHGAIGMVPTSTVNADHTLDGVLFTVYAVFSVGHCSPSQLPRSVIFTRCFLNLPSGLNRTKNPHAPSANRYPDWNSSDRYQSVVCGKNLQAYFEAWRKPVIHVKVDGVAISANVFCGFDETLISICEL